MTSYVIIDSQFTYFGADFFRHVIVVLLFGRSRMIVGHHRLTDELFPAAAILLVTLK